MSLPLNIAFIVSSDGQSGTYFRYHNLAIALVQRGHTVTVYSQSVTERVFRREEVREGVHYVIAPSFPLNRFFAFSFHPGNIVRRFLTMFQKSETLCHHHVFHLFQPFENSTFTWSWLRRNRLCNKESKILYAWDWDDLWTGGLYKLENMKRLQDRWHYRLMRKHEHDLPGLADMVTTCSKFLADRARVNGAREIEVIYNGFWPETADSPTCREESRQYFSLDPKAYYLGFTGFTANEFDWCLDLLGRFSDDPSVRFVCCGARIEPILANQPESLRARIDYLDLLTPADTRRLLRAIDVGLLPLENNDFNESRLPIKFAEYLAAGLPALCSDIGEIGRLARKLDGTVLLPSDRTGWVEGSERTIRELRGGTMSCRPDPQQLKDTLSWPIMAAQLERIYFRNLAALA